MAQDEAREAVSLKHFRYRSFSERGRKGYANDQSNQTADGGASKKLMLATWHVEALTRATHGALPHRAPSTRCTAESVHRVWHRCSPAGASG